MKTKAVYGIPKYNFSSKFIEERKQRGPLPMVLGSGFDLQERKNSISQKKLLVKSSSSVRPSVKKQTTEVYVSEDSERFVLAGKSQVKKMTGQWKSIEEPPIFYRVQRSASSERLLTHEKTDDSKTFLTSLQHNEGKLERSISVKTLHGDSTGKWFPVNKQTRFVINENFVEELKPCNFRKQHQELLPVIPEKKYKRPTLSLHGKHVRRNVEHKDIEKDSVHDLRVYSRDGTPWVAYQLKTSLKPKQDPFCVNYSALLAHRNTMASQKSLKRLEYFKSDSAENFDSTDQSKI